MDRLSVNKSSLVIALFSFLVLTIFPINAQDSTGYKNDVNSKTHNTKSDTTIKTHGTVKTGSTTTTETTTTTTKTESDKTNNNKSINTTDKRKNDESATKDKKKNTSLNSGYNSSDNNFAGKCANNLKKKVKLSQEQVNQVEGVLHDFQSEVTTAMIEKNNFAGVILLRDIQSDFATNQETENNTEKNNTGVSHNVTTTSGNSTVTGKTRLSDSAGINGNAGITTTSGTTAVSDSVGVNANAGVNASAETTGMSTSDSINSGVQLSGTTGVNTSDSLNSSTQLTAQSPQGSVTTNSNFNVNDPDNQNRAAARSSDDNTTSDNTTSQGIFADDRTEHIDKAQELADNRIESILNDNQKSKYNEIKSAWWSNVRQESLNRNWARTGKNGEEYNEQEHFRSESYTDHTNMNNEIEKDKSGTSTSKESDASKEDTKTGDENIDNYDKDRK